ncbi:SDR family oxidoreductase [Pseudenhygromyxa sp. WMMC2535]|uniref:SDR family oxidoreductase n=1 Tax=Pseudenhygromyxa sp. WMMC2535 TaxID=2712867 RepID=UPI001551E5F7|nr:SDR family oxidoreductase [Pseudenhygromyxa sp. WMMC2535]NVB41088.1 SDR family oxidoreductase [Pseudenhygromyxa sp. WMMC2535]
MTTTLIIGANRGIGLELARQLQARGERVIAACRKPTPELEALGIQVETGVEVTDSDSLDALAARLGDVRIDVLIHNAGILAPVSLDDLDFDSIREQFEVNAMGPLRAVSALRGHLGEGSKIALVTSRMGSITDNDSGGSYGYRMSKTALNMAGSSLAIDLRGEGVAVILLHPGWVRTDMTQNTGLIDADEAARGMIARIDALTLEDSGSFWHQKGERLPW